MGQRLNVEIIDDHGECVANAYYHWSAYSVSALQLIIPILGRMVLTGPTTEEAIELFELTGAKLSKDDFQFAKEMGLKTGDFQGCNRNNGLISIIPESMEKTRHWEEGRISIHITERFFDYNVLREFNGEEYSLEKALEAKEKATVLHGFKSLDNIHFSEFSKFLSFIQEAENKNGVIKVGEKFYNLIY